MPIIEMVNLDRRKSESIQLLRSAKNIHSQAGEDGILEKIYEIIGTKNKWCVEFGAWDGIHLSNTCHLIRDQAWMGVQIEGNPKRFKTLEQNFEKYVNSIRVCAIVGFTPGVDTIDHILKKTDIPTDFDLISIDIDGNDWYIWDSIAEFRPRVVVIEYNASIPNDVIFIQDRDFKINEGCSLAALVKLGKEKGYELVGATHVNGFFVVKEEFDKFGMLDNSVDAIRSTARGRIWFGYNGKIYQTMDKFAWALKGVEARPDMFQVLSPAEMSFGDGISKLIPEATASSDKKSE